MIFGASYYPEITPECEWTSDLDAMQSAGMTVLRILDFAWTALEPREGEYDFTWLDRFLGLAEARGMKAVICTPTAAALPKSWFPKPQSPERSNVHPSNEGIDGFFKNAYFFSESWKWSPLQPRF